MSFSKDKYFLCRYFHIEFKFKIKRRPWQAWTLICVRCYTCSYVNILNTGFFFSNKNNWLFKCFDCPVKFLQTMKRNTDKVFCIDINTQDIFHNIMPDLISFLYIWDEKLLNMNDLLVRVGVSMYVLIVACFLSLITN